jgi:RNA recognition motif-containing protein
MATKLFVAGFGQTNRADIGKILGRFGEVLNVSVNDKGYAFVLMANGAEEAIAALNGTMYPDENGRKLLVQLAKLTDPKTRPDPTDTLFIQGVEMDIREDEVRAFFSGFNVADVSCSTGKNFCFVRFSSLEDAKSALNAKDSEKIRNNFVDIVYAKGKAHRSAHQETLPSKDAVNVNVFVAGMKQSTSEEITALFSKYGDVRNVSVNEKGFAFVTMASGAAEAISKLNGVTYPSDENGRRLVVQLASNQSRGEREVTDNSTLFIRGVETDIRESEIRDFFSAFQIVEAVTFVDKDFCFARFPSVEQARTALKEKQGGCIRHKQVDITYKRVKEQLTNDRDARKRSPRRDESPKRSKRRENSRRREKSQKRSDNRNNRDNSKDRTKKRDSSRDRNNRDNSRGRNNNRDNSKDRDNNNSNKKRETSKERNNNNRDSSRNRNTNRDNSRERNNNNDNSRNRNTGNNKKRDNSRERNTSNNRDNSRNRNNNSRDNSRERNNRDNSRTRNNNRAQSKKRDNSRGRNNNADNTRGRNNNRDISKDRNENKKRDNSRDRNNNNTNNRDKKRDNSRDRNDNRGKPDDKSRGGIAKGRNDENKRARSSSPKRR